MKWIESVFKLSILHSKRGVEKSHEKDHMCSIFPYSPQSDMVQVLVRIG